MTDPKDPEALAAAKEAERIARALNSLKVSFQEVASQLGDIKLNVNYEGVASLQSMKETIDAINQSATENLSIDSSRLDLGISSLENLENMAKRQLALGKMSKDEYDQIVKSVGEKKKKYEYSKQDVEESKKAFENSLMLNKDTFQLNQKLEVINKIKNANLSVEEKANYKRQFALALMTAMVDKINDIAAASLKTALALDDSVRGLMKGANFSYKNALDSLLEMAPMAAASALGIQELGSSMETLKQEFAGFTALSIKQQNTLTLTAAQLNQMGLAASASAGFLDTATKSLAMSETQATEFLTSLKGFADKSGITMQQLSKNIAGSREQIVKFGQDGPRVFKEMSLVSKQLGLELNTLFDITERFTTFDGAADAAGKLNAILGGDFINSVDLMTAGLEDPTEAFRILKFGLDESGKSFMDLDNASRRAIASAAGLSLEQATRMFTTDIDTATSAMREKAKTEEEMAKISGKMAGIQERLQKSFIALYPAIEPIIKAFASFAEKFTEVMIVVAKYLKDSPNFVTGLKVLAVSFTVVMGALASMAIVILPLLTTLASMQAIGMSLGYVFGALRAPFVFLRGIWATITGAKAVDTAASGANTAAEGLNAAAKKATGAETAKETLQTELNTAEKVKNTGATNASTAASRAAALAMRAKLVSMAALIASAGALLIGIGAAAAGIAYFVQVFKELSVGEMLAVSVALGLLGFGLLKFIVAVGAMSAVGSGVVALAVGVLFAMGAGFFLLGAGIKMASQGISKMKTNLPTFAQNIKDLNDVKFDKIEEIAKIFERMAKAVEKTNSFSSILFRAMRNIGSMGSTEKVSGSETTENIVKQSTRSISMSDIEVVNIKVPEIKIVNPVVSENAKKDDKKSQEQINVTITMNTPIMLDGKKIGAIAKSKVEKVLNSARNGNIVIDLD